MKTNLLKRAVCKTRYLAMLLLLMFAHVQAWGKDATLTINYNSFSSHGTSYADQAWCAASSVGDVISGSATVCFTNGQTYIQLKNGHPAFRNTVALPGAIKSVKLTRQSTGSNRQVTLYAGTVELTSSNYSSSGVSIGAKTVTTAGVTWTFTSAQISAKYKYFYFHGSSNVLNLDNAVITYDGSDCNAIDVSGGSAVILPKGSTTYSTNDWKTKGAPTAYPASATLCKINGYCTTLTQVADFGDADGLRFKASAGVMQISGITSTSGIEVEILCSGTNGFQVELTGATTKTAQTGTVSISTTSTNATLKISKNTSNQGNIKYIKITPASSCSAPTINTHPTGGASYAINYASPTALSVTATKNGSGPDLTYQWYSNTSNNNTTGTIISGATSSSYTPPTTSIGTKYYYCIVSSGACATTSNTASVTITGPVITVSQTSRAFGDRKVNGGPYSMTFTVSGTNMSANIGLAISGTNAGMFSLSQTSLTPSAGSVATTEITVYYSPTTAASHSAQVNITSTDAVTKTVTLSGTGKWEVAWVSNGGTVSTTLVANNTKPTFPVNPSSCDGTSTSWVGWTKTTWSGKKDQSYINGLTGDAVVHTSNSTMANITANGTTYHAVFAKKTGSEVTDLINRALVVGANSSIGTNNNSTWATATVNGSSSGAKYFIRSMGLNNATNYAIRWNANGYLYTSTAPTAGYKLKSITVTTTGTKAVALFAATSAYTGVASATSLGDNLSATTSGATYSLTTAQLASNYTCVGINGTASSTEVVSISITYSNASYSDYLTTCCENIITLNTPTITGTGATITFDKSSPVLTCSAAQDVTASLTVTNGYKVTALSFTLSAGTYTIDPAISTPYTSSQDFTLSFTQNHAAATLTTTATVEALHDKYKDYLHGNPTIDKEGNYGTAPSLSSQTAATDAGCKDNHYKFRGWVAESDVNTDGTLKGGYVLIAGGATGKYATGATYIAVWAEEVE